jgi:hypothetical protein
LQYNTLANNGLPRRPGLEFPSSAVRAFVYCKSVLQLPLAATCWRAASDAFSQDPQQQKNDHDAFSTECTTEGTAGHIQRIAAIYSIV